MKKIVNTTLRHLFILNSLCINIFLSWLQPIPRYFTRVRRNSLYVYWYTRTNEYKRNNIRSQTKDWRVFRKYCSKCTAAGSMRTRAYSYCDGLGNMQRDYKVLHNAPSGRNDITTRHTTYTHISTWFTRRFYSVFYAFGPCREISLFPFPLFLFLPFSPPFCVLFNPPFRIICSSNCVYRRRTNQSSCEKSLFDCCDC